MLLIPTVLFTSCKDDEVKEPTALTLTNYMKTSSVDLTQIADGFVYGTLPANDGEIATWAGNFYIMDIRSSNDFNAGHIAGAHNVAFANILTESANATKPILMVCYTGQTACYATALLRMYGKMDTKALKWGMSSWNTSLDRWSTSVGNSANGHANWTNAAAPTPSTYELPTIESSLTEGNAILKERVEKVVADGFKTVSGVDVLTTPANYYINNYFSDADYLAYGHINGAFRISPLTIADDYVKKLDPSKKIVNYCYTGQTSAILTAYLRVLGYDAYSMSFGMNGIYNNNTAWGSNKWTSSIPKSLALSTK